MFVDLASMHGVNFTAQTIATFMWRQLLSELVRESDARHTQLSTSKPVFCIGMECWHNMWEHKLLGDLVSLVLDT